MSAIGLSKNEIAPQVNSDSSALAQLTQIFMSRKNIFHLTVSGLTLLAASLIDWLVFGQTSPARNYFLWHVGFPNAWRMINLIPRIVSAIAAGNVHGRNEFVFLVAFTIQWSLVGLVFSYVLLLFKKLLFRQGKTQN